MGLDATGPSIARQTLIEAGFDQAPKIPAAETQVDYESENAEIFDCLDELSRNVNTTLDAFLGQQTLPANLLEYVSRPSKPPLKLPNIAERVQSLHDSVTKLSVRAFALTEKHNCSKDHLRTILVVMKSQFDSLCEATTALKEDALKKLSTLKDRINRDEAEPLQRERLQSFSLISHTSVQSLQNEAVAKSQKIRSERVATYSQLNSNWTSILEKIEDLANHLNSIHKVFQKQGDNSTFTKSPF